MLKHKLHLTKIFNIYITKKFSVNLWVLPVFLCSIIGGYSDIFSLAYITALLHEMAHVLSARLLKVSVSEVRIYPFGVNAKLSSNYIRSSEKEFIIAFAGPLMNIILFWCSIMFKNVLGAELSVYCADLNLAMCAINLVPSLPLDGGRMLKSIITSRYGIIRSYNFMLKLSKIIIIILISVSVIFFFVSDFNFSLILISAFLLQNLCAEQQNVSIITLKEILSNRTKLSDAQEYPSKSICVSYDSPARTILKHLSYDYYYIIHITDSDSKIIKTVTETEVLSTLTQKGIRTIYRDIV